MTQDRTCVITGASRGIGQEIAIELAHEGHNVVVNYRSSADAAEDVVETIESRTDGSAIAVQADVTDLDSVKEMAAQTHDVFGSVDVLINNAGITRDSLFSRMEPEAWHAVIDVHLNGMFNATHTFFEDIQAADAGRLINISSIVGQQGNLGQANYAAAKSGMFGFTKTMALELAESGSTANCVAPGFTKTDMLDDVRDEVCDEIREEIPLDRFGTVEDIVPPVRFLASPESGYITGEVIAANGGMHR